MGRKSKGDGKPENVLRLVVLAQAQGRGAMNDTKKAAGEQEKRKNSSKKGGKEA